MTCHGIGTVSGCFHRDTTEVVKEGSIWYVYMDDAAAYSYQSYHLNYFRSNEIMYIDHISVEELLTHYCATIRKQAAERYRIRSK